MNYSEDQYAQLLGELYNRHPSVQTAGFAAGAYKPGLDAMRRFDAALGHPSQQIRTLHVAGTNGKGSVCSMLAAALSATGLRVGLYTSPTWWISASGSSSWGRTAGRWSPRSMSSAS